MITCLVTGGTGFVGRHLVDLCRAKTPCIGAEPQVSALLARDRIQRAAR